MYIAVSVPEDDLRAVYELLLSRSSRREASASQPAMDKPAVEAVAEPAIDSGAIRDAIARVWRRVTDPGRAVLHATAQHAPDELNLEQLQAAADVPNASAALQSIAIQLQKEPLLPKLNLLFEMRQVEGRFRYTMRSEIAAIVLDLANEA
jgi:hypothetical protein